MATKGLTPYKVVKLCKSEMLTNSKLSRIKAGSIGPSDEVLEALCSVEELELDMRTLKTWLAIEKYPEAFDSKSRVLLFKELARSPEELADALEAMQDELKEEYYQVLKTFVEQLDEPPKLPKDEENWLMSQLKKVPFRVRKEGKNFAVLIGEKEIQGM